MICSACSGRGRLTCRTCGGSGKMAWAGGQSLGCPGCSGAGTEQCTSCFGHGTLIAPTPNNTSGIDSVRKDDPTAKWISPVEKKKLFVIDGKAGAMEGRGGQVDMLLDYLHIVREGDSGYFLKSVLVSTSELPILQQYATGRFVFISDHRFFESAKLYWVGYKGNKGKFVTKHGFSKSLIRQVEQLLR